MRMPGRSLPVQVRFLMGTDMQIETQFVDDSSAGGASMGTSAASLHRIEVVCGSWSDNDYISCDEVR